MVYGWLYRKNKEVLEDMELGDRIQALGFTYEAVASDYEATIKKLD